MPDPYVDPAPGRPTLAQIAEARFAAAYGAAGGGGSAAGRTYAEALVRDDHVLVDARDLTPILVASDELLAVARALDGIISGAITRDANGAATTAPVLWPDGATGVYAATTLSAVFAGSVDAYTVTHVLGGVTTTYTQPAVTRDATGAVTNRPAITVA